MTRPRRLATLGLLAAALAVPPTTGFAAPSGQHHEPRAAAADRDHDKVSDDFAPRLRAARDDQSFDVLVTGLSSAQAHAAVGSFPVRRELALVHGFAARLTAKQARDLAREQRTRRVEEDHVLRITD